MAGILDLLGFGPSRRRGGSKMSRLKRQERKLNKKLEEEKVAKRIKTKRKKLGLY